MLARCLPIHTVAIVRVNCSAPRLTRLQQQDAIERPAQSRGVETQPALVQRLLNDAEDDPDKLPALQHVLNRASMRALLPLPFHPHPRQASGA